LNFDVGAEQSLAVLVGEQQNWLGHVAYVALDEEWLVLLDEIAGVSAGYVVKIHGRESSRIEIQSNRFHTSARNRRADGAPVQHPREHQVVGVAGLSRRLADAVLSWNTGADPTRHALPSSSRAGGFVARFTNLEWRRPPRYARRLRNGPSTSSRSWRIQRTAVPSR
jgi:hypothetical protein